MAPNLFSRNLSCSLGVMGSSILIAHPTIMPLGLAEKFIQSLKHSLKASQHDGRSLSQCVSSYLLSYRSTTHATTGVAPCKLLMQRDLRTRIHLLKPSCEKSVLDHQAQQKLLHDQRARVREWNVGACVMVFARGDLVQIG